MDAGAIVGGAIAIVGGVVWIVRIEGRVNLGEERYRNLKEDLEEIKTNVRKILENGHVK